MKIREAITILGLGIIFGWYAGTAYSEWRMERDWKEQKAHVESFGDPKRIIVIKDTALLEETVQDAREGDLIILPPGHHNL